MGSKKDGNDPEFLTFRIQKKIDRIGVLEKEIDKLLCKLPRWECECNCDEPEVVDFHSEGEHGREISTYCIKCGGIVADIR